SPMARPRKQTDLDVQLLTIAQRMTSEVAQIVRQTVAAEMSRIINSSINGIGIGIVNGGGGGGGARLALPAGRRGRRGGPSEPLLATVLDTIKRSPGLRSEQPYQKIR